MTTEAQTPSSSGSMFKVTDLVPFFAVACMMVGFILYTGVKADPATGVKPHNLNYIWGKDILMPVGNFLLFAYLLLAQVVPMLRETLKSRRKDIVEAVQSFDEQSGHIADRFSDIKEKLDNVEEETTSIIANAKTQAEEEKAHSIVLAKKQAERIQKSADDLTSYERHRINQRLKKRLIDRAFNRAEELIKENITDEDQSRLRTDYLNLVDKIS